MKISQKIRSSLLSAMLGCSLLLAPFGQAFAVGEGRGPFKVLSVYVDVVGNLYIRVNQTVTTAANCAPTDIVGIPKTIPALGQSVPDAAISRIEALALQAKTTNSDIYFWMESVYGCAVGSYYPVVSQFELR